MVTEQKFSRSAAVHEAGHAIVAWFFGLPLGAMRIDAGDSGGETQIGCSDRLTLAEQIAVRCAGGIAQAIFECPGNEVAALRQLRSHEAIGGARLYRAKRRPGRALSGLQNC
jgi:hypothetical protein